jgi:predicted transposase YbfD/YdcC
MSKDPISGFSNCFSGIRDPRIERCRKHKLLDIIGLCLIGVVCGCDSWVEIEEYGKAKEEFLKNYFEFSNGIPSHDTIGRVMQVLDPKELHSSLVEWTKLLVKKKKGEVIAIDGKAIRGSADTINGKSWITMVSAWAFENNLVLAQEKVEDKSNEITAIPKLLDAIDVAGCIVTIDAMGTQKSIAQKIRAQKADYILALKRNHETLHEEVEHLFRYIEKQESIHIETDVDKGHGRIERRITKVISIEQANKWMDKSDLVGWKDLASIVCVEAHRELKDKTESGKRYYLSSITVDELTSKKMGRLVRSHWSIENNLHWVLDVVFKEDLSQVRKGHADENFSTIRKMALNLLKNNKSKASIKRKRMKAGWDNQFLLNVLNPIL